MHRYRNDHHLQTRFNKSLQAIRQQCAQSARNRLHTPIFEQMNQGAELTVVSAIGNSFDKSRRRQAAGLAQGIRSVTGYRGNREVGYAQVFPTASAKNTWLRGQMSAAGIADGDAGKTQEGAAAEGAGAGEQRTGEAVGGTSQYTHNSPPNRSLRRRDVESQGLSLTREDAPHSRPARLRSCPAANEQSIRVSQARRPAPL
jgi:hypothetical protein